MLGRSGARLALISDADHPTLFMPTSAPLPVRWPTNDGGSRPLRRAVLLGCDHLLHRREVGQAYWAGRPSGDTGLRARLLLLLLALKLEVGGRAERLADRLIAEQLPEGGWASRSGASCDLSTSVLAYLAIKLLRGRDVMPPLRGARQAIRSLGGLDSVDDETNAWLSLFGQAELRRCDAEVPWLPAIEAGLGRSFDATHGVRELLCTAGDTEVHPESLTELPHAARLLWRRLSLEASTDAGEIEAVERQVESLIHDDDDEIDLAPARSREQETALVVEAFAKAGRSDEIEAPAAWLAEQVDAILDRGNAQLAAAVLRALEAVGSGSGGVDSGLPPGLRLVTDVHGDSHRPTAASQPRVGERAAVLVSWLIDRQADDGSWGDAATTATVVHALASSGEEATRREAIEYGVAWLAGMQRRDGSWNSNGVGDMEMTARAVHALAVAKDGSSFSDDSIVLGGVNWLLAEQQEPGGWSDREVGVPSSVTPADSRLTALVVDALVAADQTSGDWVSRAIDSLLDAQSDDGGWSSRDASATAAVVGAMAAAATIPATPTSCEEPVCLRLVGADTVAS